ncbi:hypothetical protein BKA62DRAFT_715411 [Auriculariales sp. MPI-PUGE-AT-0066]|nr:hypothetical protein BKA62DRAFT_715411 [Auriculariales sp. MPI-PUGE-AT-0066]
MLRGTINHSLSATSRNVAAHPQYRLCFASLSDLLLLQICLLLELGDRIAMTQTCHSLPNDNEKDWTEPDPWPPVWDAIDELTSRAGVGCGRLFWIFEVTENSIHAASMRNKLALAFGRTSHLRLEPFGKYTYPAVILHEQPTCWVMGSMGAAQFAQLVPGLCMPAPRLVVLQLSFWYSSSDQARPQHVLPTALLDASPNVLSACLVDGIALAPTHYPAFSNLLVFDYALCDALIRPEDLRHLLAGMRRLQYLGLDCAGISSIDRQVPLLPVSLKGWSIRFTELDVTSSTQESARIIASIHNALIVRASNDCRLIIQTRGWAMASLFAMWFLFPQMLQHPTAIDAVGDLCVVHYVHLNISLSINHKSQMLAPQGSPRAFREALVLQVTTMSISADFWSELPFGDALCLCSLTIHFLPCPEYPELSYIFVPRYDGRNELVRWRCPRLSELRFVQLPSPDVLDRCRFKMGWGPWMGRQSRCCCESGGTICIEDVATFVRQRLQFDADRLRVIGIHGFSSLHWTSVDFQGALLSLNEVAEHVDLDGEIPATSRQVLEDHCRRYRPTRALGRWTPTAVFTDILQCRPGDWDCLSLTPAIEDAAFW